MTIQVDERQRWMILEARPAYQTAILGECYVDHQAIEDIPTAG